MRTTYKIQYTSVVRCYAEHEIEAESPEEAAKLAEAWINGNVSALDWTDVDGDPVAGFVEDGEVRFAVWEGGEEGAHLGDDEVLLARAVDADRARHDSDDLRPCPTCGRALRLCHDNDPACAYCDHCGWCGDGRP